MSLSRSKCWYSNNCLHFLKSAVSLAEQSSTDLKFKGLNPAAAGTGIK